MFCQSRRWSAESQKDRVRFLWLGPGFLLVCLFRDFPLRSFSAFLRLVRKLVSSGYAANLPIDRHSLACDSARRKERLCDMISRSSNEMLGITHHSLEDARRQHCCLSHHLSPVVGNLYMPQVLGIYPSRSILRFNCLADQLITLNLLAAPSNDRSDYRKDTYLDRNLLLPRYQNTDGESKT